MIRGIIIDDEPNNITNLQRLLEKYCPEVIIVGSSSDPNNGIKLIKDSQPDLVFLDIHMPEKDGFQVLKDLDSYDFEVIFVTAFSQYGIQAIKFSAIDYLLKPIDIEELKKAVAKTSNRLKHKNQNLQLQNLLHHLKESNNNSDHRIAISSLKETRFVYVKNIVRCESENSYTLFFTDEGETIISTVPLYEYDEMLSIYGFIRCHQSHLVNKKYVRSLLKEDGYTLLLYNQNRIPVSRNKKDLVKKALV
ncbi:LytR/AlgR family response regulator transcription factor [Flavobacterium gilvum]|uniref:DNA-binding response regulator n=1 Tax=Flavobacterium gilvum TaxID=1492737 RepID=A0AAC9I4C5_9FLAO|nr:LytTR family DNA-binding domain-containing protein [Flavobacterium gilvum]AOW10629.1 DNA-binding response regulator [Flavobacterium gilvum]KFC59077.1 chemotaxis protein CheY [Flavobacterium gilvum]